MFSLRLRTSWQILNLSITTVGLLFGFLCLVWTFFGHPLGGKWFLRPVFLFGWILLAAIFRFFWTFFLFISFFLFIQVLRLYYLLEVYVGLDCEWNELIN